MKKLSLKIRLIISFCAASIAILGGAGVLSWFESREQIDEFFDTYQLLLVRQLATADWGNIQPSTQKRVNRIVDNLDDDGEEEDEALGFAVFDNQGKMIFHDDENGRLFNYHPQVSGFEEQKIGAKKKLWRIVWMQSADGRHRIAVGQEIAYRDEVALDLIEETLVPWLCGLGALLLMIILLVHMELRPLRQIAGNIARRSPDDFSQLAEKQVPQEILPLTKAMNQLFGRIEQMLRRERSFISDSAHELRSPLTALKVQLEVAEMSGDDKEALQKALVNLRTGIERSSRLVEQLLALSRLDSSLRGIDTEEALDWNTLLANAVEEQQAAAGRALAIEICGREKCSIRSGRNFLWSLLLRNLLDNAVRYSPENSEIKIEFTTDGMIVSNSGVTLDAKHLAHLGERFFRPAGQKAQGSGLGLSIVEKIAALHGYYVRYENENGIFKVVIAR